MALLYVDEQLGDFVSPLTDAGHDVIFAGDVGRGGRTDTWHFREAIDTQRVLLTFNRRDFEYLHKLWTTLHVLGVITTRHAGILTSAPTKTFKPRDWLPVVIDRLSSAAVPRGRLYRWLPRSAEWREDDARPEED